MDCNVCLRGVKWPKWHAIGSMHTPYTLIDTLKNAKVNAQTARIPFKIRILCIFRALSVQYNAFVSNICFIILVCSHAAIDSRGALGFWQWCHLGFHGVRHRLWKHTSILVVCIWQEEVHNINIYIYIYIIYTYMSTHTHIHKYIYIYVYICIYVQISTQINVQGLERHFI